MAVSIRTQIKTFVQRNSTLAHPRDTHMLPKHFLYPEQAEHEIRETRRVPHRYSVVHCIGSILNRMVGKCLALFFFFYCLQDMKELWWTSLRCHAPFSFFLSKFRVAILWQSGNGKKQMTREAATIDVQNTCLNSGWVLPTDPIVFWARNSPFASSEICFKFKTRIILSLKYFRNDWSNPGFLLCVRICTVMITTSLHLCIPTINSQMAY